MRQGSGSQSSSCSSHRPPYITDWLIYRLNYLLIKLWKWLIYSLIRLLNWLIYSLIKRRAPACLFAKYKFFFSNTFKIVISSLQGFLLDLICMFCWGFSYLIRLLVILIFNFLLKLNLVLNQLLWVRRYRVSSTKEA